MFEVTDEIDNIKYNRKQRREMIKNLMKTTIVPIYDENGDVKGTTTQYKQERKKERNLGAWLNRVRKSQEMGKAIQNANGVTGYNRRNEIAAAEIEKTKKMLSEALNNFIDLYGEEDGQLRYKEYYEELLKSR